MTENVNPRFGTFDQWPTFDAVKVMHESQVEALTAIEPALDAIACAADAAATRLGTCGRLIYVGAGTSGRIAVQDGAELGPTFGWPENRTVYCMAGGMQALTISAEGAEDIARDGAAAIRNARAGSHDIVLGVSASGTTPYTIGALKEAQQMGALTIGIANNARSPLLDCAGHGILVESGSEIIAGSTRMKAGTTQKVVLNMLSTAIMIRLGRVYKGLMVDMIVSNKKLERRAVNMVCEITSCSREDAVAALGQSDQNIKLAVMIALGETMQSGSRILQNANGNLRQALALQNHA